MTYNPSPPVHKTWNQVQNVGGSGGSSSSAPGYGGSGEYAARKVTVGGMPHVSVEAFAPPSGVPPYLASGNRIRNPVNNTYLTTDLARSIFPLNVTEYDENPWNETGCAPFWGR